MPTPVNIQEQLVGFGFRKQSAIATANVVDDVWCLNKISAAVVNAKPVTEDDRDAFGKGHEFPTMTYPSHWEVGPHTMEKYASSEIVAWAAAFGLGVAAKTGTTPNFIYTCTPSVPVTDGIEHPYFSYIQQMRPGASVVLDEMLVGLSVEDFLVTLATGPGRSNSKIAINFVGCGRSTVPSGIALPAMIAEKELPGASLALTIIGVDYVTLKDIVSIEWGWKNNLRPTGFYPGSGVQDGYAVQGRLEHGAREGILRFTVRFKNGSAEYTKLRASTTGTAVLTQTYDANNTYTATFHQLGFRSVDLGETDGLVTVAVEGSAQYHSTNGVLTVVAKTAHDNICQAPA